MKRLLALALLLLLSFGAAAAPTFDAASSNAANIDVISVSHTATGTDLYAFICVLNDGSTPTSVTYNATPATPITSQGRLFAYGSTVTAGTQTVSVDSSVGATNQVLGVVTYTGVDQTTPIGTAVTAQTTDPATSVAATVTSATGGLVVDCAQMVSLTMSADAGQTERLSIPESSHGIGFFAYGMSEKAGAASVTMTWIAGGTGGDNDIIAVPLNAAAGASSGLLLRRRRN